MKLRTILVAAVMILGLSAAAYAQATFSVGSIPVTTVTSSGNTERTGDITFSQISGTSLVGTITISYGVPITVPIDNTAIRAVGTGGYLDLVEINEDASDNASGVVVINVNTNAATAGTIRLTGVRVAIAGTTLTSLSATISTTGNAIVAGQTTVVVISSVAPGIAGVGPAPAAGGTSGVVNGVSGVIVTQPVASAKEGYLAAWAPQGTGDTTSVLLRFKLDKNPPAGVTVTFPGTATAGDSGWSTSSSSGTVSGAAVTISSTTESLNVYYRISTPTDPTLIETILVNVTLAVDTTKAPYAPVSVNYTVSMAPVSAAFNADGTVKTSPIPRYAALEVGPAVLFSIIGSQTSMLIPYASFALGYNTGFSIANTTTDPGPTALGVSAGAVKQTGKLTFYLYPQLATPSGTLGTPIIYTTSSTSPGTGLDANGNLPSGSTYTVLLSQILSAAGVTGDFSGYAIVTANFTNAHCLFVVSNFTTFSQGALALIVDGARSGGTEALNN